MAFDHELYTRFRTARNVGFEVSYRDESGSTMDEARQGAAAGGALGTAYVAGVQSAGRGRLGRTFTSAAGQSMLVTYHLDTRDAAVVPLFTVAAALAVADSIRETSHVVTDIKWPNDVLYDGRKIAGILAETAHGERVDVFLGIGVNLGRSAFPPELAEIATSIEDAGAPPPGVEEYLAALSAALERHLTRLQRSPAVVVEEWRTRLITLGQRVTLTAQDGTVTAGEAIDVSPRGELVLRLADGSLASFAAGDVTTH